MFIYHEEIKMKSQIKRVLIPNEANADATKQLALEKSISLAKEEKPVAAVTILFETMRNLQTLASVIGKNNIEDLKKHRSFVQDGVKFNLQTLKDFSPELETNILLGIHLSASSGIRKLDDVVAAQTIIFLPWLHSEGKEWKATWNPHCTSTEYDNVPDFALAPALEEELAGLPKQIGHTLDNDRMKKGLKSIRKSFSDTGAETIRRWALRTRFNSDQADKIKKWFK
jgi:hypothetical protein